MNGGDQRPPEPGVARAVAEANAAGGRYRFEVADLARWLEEQRAEVPDGALPLWRGELRSAARAPMLSGMISNRVDVRAAAAAAERAVERRAEPLLALFRPPSEWTAAVALLGIAWNRLIANSAHDSACACCTDDVADQVLVRYAEARQIGDALADRALADLAAETGTAPGAVLVVNTSPRTRSGIVEVTVPAGPEPTEDFVGPDGIGRAVQLLGVGRDEAFVARVVGSKVGWVADRMAGTTFDGRPVRTWSLEPGPKDAPTTMTFQAAGLDDAPLDLDEARDALLALGRAGRPVTVRMEGPPRRRILVETGPVPGYGWTTLRRPPAGGGGEASAMPVRVGAGPGGGPTLDNGLVRVEVDTEDGTFTITTRSGLRAEGLNRYADGGDGGDTYTWCPPAADTVVDRPRSVTVEVEETGPLRGRMLITAGYEWPTHADGDEQACSARSVQTTTATLRTTVSLVAGDPVVGVETVLDNRCRDHRLRAHFPLPVTVTGSDAGCAFAVVHRGLDAEGGPSEQPPPTFPARRFVDCSGEAGLALIADGTFEYEVCNEGRELAVTLLRATGWLSRRRLAVRPDPAGPALRVGGAQVQGERRWRYGLLLHARHWEAADVTGRASAFLDPLEAVAGPGTATGSRRPAEGQVLRVDGAEVSAVGRDGDGLVVRLFNPGAELASARVGGPEVTAIEVGLRPGEIVTVRPTRRPGPG
jgi:hypothetical protein